MDLLGLGGRASGHRSWLRLLGSGFWFRVTGKLGKQVKRRHTRLRGGSGACLRVERSGLSVPVTDEDEC